MNEKLYFKIEAMKAAIGYRMLDKGHENAWVGAGIKKEVVLTE